MIKVTRPIYLDTNLAFGPVETDADWGKMVNSTKHLSYAEAEEYLLNSRQTKYAAADPSVAHHFGTEEQHRGETLREYLAEIESPWSFTSQSTLPRLITIIMSQLSHQLTIIVTNGRSRMPVS